MKYIFKEFNKEELNYSEYAFPYKVYLKASEKDSKDEIYEKGFLATRIEENYYYLSRNVRIDLEKYSQSSENRRVLKKTKDLKLENKKLKDFIFDYKITKLATEYFKAKFEKNIISTQSLKKIFEQNFFTNILIFKLNDKEVGYCITMETENLIHYAYPFYGKEFIGTNIGMGMILKTLEYAKENGKKYLYLGTAYTKSSKYKLQFKGLEWFDEGSWNSNIDNLKKKIDEK